ncbi:glucose-1-phosphate adenylyltransferase, partial [Candidatus Gastranaerophilus sp. (ex Termes propinquus)]
FTNADISRAYESLKTLPDAALVIPYYPVDAERAKSFGLLGVEKDEAGNLQIKDFVEKPRYTTNIPDSTKFHSNSHYEGALVEYNSAQKAKNDKGEFMANPGMYFIGRDVIDVLTAHGHIESLGGKYSDIVSTGLGANVMPAIVQLCNEGKLLTKDGKPMKVYTVPLERADGKPAVWDDIGTAEAYLDVVKDVARETASKGVGHDNKYYGISESVLKDFEANVDLKQGIVYASKESRDAFGAFKEAKGVDVAAGNMYIAS